MTIGEFSRAVEQDPRSEAADKRILFENGYQTSRGLGYVVNGDFARAVDAAIALGRPLLVAGEPGCGKTELGHAIARHLQIPRLHLYSVKSTSDANELFYTYDAIKRFRESQGAVGGAEVGDYVEFQALGRAILDAHERDRIAHLLRGAHADYRATNDPGPMRSVVVIDEIDKASADFANDLLHEIEGLRFRVKEFPAMNGPDGLKREPETPPGDAIAPEHRPIVVITSNEERQLPDAFLRRCVFLDVPFPDQNTLKTIVENGLINRLRRMLGRDAAARHRLDAARRDALVDFFLRFRGVGPQKAPGIAELLDAAALAAIAPDKPLEAVAPAIVKTRPDGKKAADAAATMR
jgi:MoxR-like ATPase